MSRSTAKSSPAATPYRWFAVGDINGFFGLAFDNLSVMSFLAGILIGVFNFPADIVFTRMFPGTAFGVLVGDLIYTWMAFRLARRTGNANVTAMPLGLDTPSTIGIALVVLGPAFVSFKASGMPEREAAMMAWYTGMATMVLIGVVKLVLSFFGSFVQRTVPQAGLLGSLAGIGLALIGFLPLVEIFAVPLVGVVALGIVLYTLVARVELPARVPGVLAAIIVGTVLYHLLGPGGWLGGIYAPPAAELHIGLPWPTLLFVQGLVPALQYLPVAIPFALLTVVGGINVTESARVAGDDFKTRDILLTEAVATLVAGVCGGVAQSTPYIGQPAYKRMGARAGYTLFTALFIGLGGVLGYVSFIVEAVPRAVLAPILVFVALDIMVQAFAASPRAHAPAVAFAYMPTIARLIGIKVSNPELVPPQNFAKLMRTRGKELPELLITWALGNGFILTALLWGGILAEMIDRRLRRAALYLAVLAGFTFFGITHSSTPAGNMYLPWRIADDYQRCIPYQFSLAYLILAAALVLLSFTRESHMPRPADDEL